MAGKFVELILTSLIGIITFVTIAGVAQLRITGAKKNPLIATGFRR